MTMFGAFVGNNAADLPAYERWLGRPVDNVLSFFNDHSWQGFDDSIGYGLDLWGGSGRPVIWGVPLTVEGTPLAEVAAGRFDANFRAAAEAVAASRSGDGDPIYIRLGWEFNGDWMPWAAAGQEADFINAFRNVSEIFDSVSDRFRTVWDVNIGGGNMDPAAAYPGDAYVDVVGLDIYYNTLWDSVDAQAAFDYSVSRPFGLQWVADFAAAHGKPTAISEWGVESNGAGVFVENLAAWMAQNDMVYANYWESNAGGFPGQMRSGAYPDAAREFKETFGDQSLLDTLVLEVSADSFEGDPRFIVQVDGEQVGGVQTARASHADGASDTITLRGDFGDNPGLVTITFLNDGWGGSADRDRNLYVEQVTLNGHTLSGGSAINNAGTNTADTAGLFSNGSAIFDFRPNASVDILELRVAADSYQGDPQFIVTVDGQQFGGIQTARASHAAGQFETVTLRGDFGANPGLVTVTFLNDEWGGSADRDRNLYVEQVSLNGEIVSGGSAINNAGKNTATTAALTSNGSATFDFRDDAFSDTLAFRVSADSYEGDPQFVVRVDGQQVGGIQTAHASHAAGQSEIVTLRGDFGDGPGVVTVTFLNDAWGGRADLDRNLYVEQVSLNGQVMPGAAAALYTEGTATFTLPQHKHDFLF